MLLTIIVIGTVIYFFYSENGEDNTTDAEDELLVCFNCGYEIKEDYNFCPNCKERLKKACEKCGKPINTNWRSCPYCDHPNME